MHLPTVLTRLDTSTGSLQSRDAPPGPCTRNQSSVQRNQIGFTHQWLYAKQSFLVQPPTNCQGSVPFPEFGGPDESDFYSQSGQWLADTIIVAQQGYDYGKGQSISSKVDRTGIRKAGVQRPRARDIQCGTDSRLYQKVADLGDFGGIEPHSGALRGPCIPTLNGVPLQRRTYSPSNSPKIKKASD
jgi:hypothetical protein